MEEGSVAVLGAGPAGIAAAIELSRSGVPPVVFERDEPGGLLRNAYLVENYPGFPRGISGPDLVRLFREHLGRCSVCVIPEEVTGLEYENEEFEVRTAKRTRRAAVAVVATGTEPIKMSRPEIPPDVAERVFYEVHALRSMDGKRFAVIGAGDVAFDYALTLSLKNEVVILARGEEPRCSPGLWKRCRKSGRITFLANHRVIGFDRCAGRVEVACTCPGTSSRKIQVDHLVVAIGRQSSLGFFGSRLRAEAGFLNRNGKLYVVGDAGNGSRRQAAIAVGDGVRAAMAIRERMRGVQV